MYNYQGKLLYRLTPDGDINYYYLGNKLVAKAGTGIVDSESSRRHYKPYGDSIERE
jgi:hypothetical protein